MLYQLYFYKGGLHRMYFFTKKKSIKSKIITIPLVILFIVITLISIVTIHISKSKITNQMEMDAVGLAKQIARGMEKNNEAEELINTNVEDQIRSIGSFVSQNIQGINNDSLEKLSKTLMVDEINVTDEDGYIVYSNLSTSLGAVFGPDHISYSVLSGEKSELMENIRKSRETNDYYKYGYVKMPNGGIVQVGILANKIQALRESLQTQTLVEDLAKEESIVYALFIDKNYKCLSSSDKEDIEKKFDDADVRDTIERGKSVFKKYFSTVQQKEVYDVTVPVYKEDSIIGCINIGLSMDNVNKVIKENIIVIAILSILSFFFASFVLIFTSNKIVKALMNLVHISNKIENGELSMDIDIREKDEIGILGNSYKNMLNSLKNTIHNMKNQSYKTEDISAHLASLSQEMTALAQNIECAIQEVASGITLQAGDLSNMNDLLNTFGEKLQSIVNLIKNVDSKAKDIHCMANESSSNMEKVMQSVEQVTVAFRDLDSKISTVGDNIQEINEITILINSIADQTNLLALNASIEAARAGEAGKGFVVVAQEIRKLAEQSKFSSENINSLISTISSDTHIMMKTTQVVHGELNDQKTDINIAISSFKDIIKGINGVIPKIEEVNLSTMSINEEKNSILEKIQETSSIAQEVSASSEEIAVSSQKVTKSVEQVTDTANTLNHMTKEMREVVSSFKL